MFEFYKFIVLLSICCKYVGHVNYNIDRYSWGEKHKLFDYGTCRRVRYIRQQVYNQFVKMICWKQEKEQGVYCDVYKSGLEHLQNSRSWDCSQYSVINAYQKTGSMLTDGHVKGKLVHLHHSLLCIGLHRQMLVRVHMLTPVQSQNCQHQN